MPDDWEALRRRWELGHAANALVVFAALLATGRAIMGPGRSARRDLPGAAERG